MIYLIMSFFVYLLECSDGTYYCGYTNDITNRIKDHNGTNLGAKYTKSRRPVKLVYKEEYGTKIEAMKREYRIKRLSRKNKIALIKKGHPN